MNLRVRLLGFCTVALATGLMGCQIGPGRLKVANSHYSEAVRVAQAEQLLVNLVRMRYRDGAMFLAVTNISTQFEFDTGLDVNGNVVTQGGADSVGIGGGVRYSERPTISFSLLGGETFQKRMLRPLRVASISLLAESGWRGDRVLRLTAEGINGLKNAPTASGPTPDTAPEYQDFLEATRLIHKLRVERLLDFEYETRRRRLSAPLSATSVDGEHTISAVKAGVEFETLEGDRVQLYAEIRRLVMRFAGGADASAEVARLRDLLRLEPGRRRYDVVELEDSDFDPLEPEKRLTELGLDTRSRGWCPLLPLERRPGSTRRPGIRSRHHDTRRRPEPLRLVELCSEACSRCARATAWRRPSGAAFAVRHRGHWFYIDDGDQTTKSTFLLLGSLFTLQAGDVEEVKPVLTLPVGR